MASAGKLGRDTSTTPLRKVLCIAGAHGSYVCSREMLGSTYPGRRQLVALSQLVRAGGRLLWLPYDTYLEYCNPTGLSSNRCFCHT